MNSWYRELQKPALTPPSAVFGPVWTVLYIMIAVSIFLYVRKTRIEPPWAIYALTVLHLAFNFLWTPLFFGMKSPGWAFVDILLLDATLAVLVLVYWQDLKLASILLWPYLAWVLFATYLNAGFFTLNRS